MVTKISKGVFQVLILIIFLAAVGLGGLCYMKKVVSEAETNLKFGFVTDLEYGYKDNIGKKLPREALPELEKVVNFFNNEFEPEIVVVGGDIVESSLSKQNTTVEQFKEINELFLKLEAKRGYVFGNHDLRKLSKAELRDILGMEGNHSYQDIGDWRFVLMDTNFNSENGFDLGPNYYIGGFVNRSEFSWLKEAFNTKRPIILFSHHSPVPNEVDGQLYSNTQNILNGIELHNFLKQYRNLVLVVSGHEGGYKFKDVEGVNYLIIGNLVDMVSRGNFASLEAKYNDYTKEAKVHIDRHGGNAGTFEIKKNIDKPNLWSAWQKFKNS